MLNTNVSGETKYLANMQIQMPVTGIRLPKINARSECVYSVEITNKNHLIRGNGLLDMDYRDNNYLK